MKTAVASLIVVSLGANAVLAWKLFAPGAAGMPSSASTAISASVAVEKAGSTKASAARPSATAGKPPGESWAALTATGTDLRGLAAQLRAAGYPAHIVRAIVGARISEQFTDRMKDLDPLVRSEFWTTRMPGVSNLDPAKMAASRELSREMTQLRKEVLGPDAQQESPETAVYRKRQYGDLSTEKIALIDRIQQDYSELQQQVRGEAMGMTLREDREKLAYLEAERRKDLAAVMTPQEFDEYLLRTSNTASMMRSQLAHFGPTEQEYRAIYKLQEAYDALYGTYGTAPRTSVEASQMRQAADRKLLEDVKALLGSERGADYERSRDYTFQSAAQIVKRMDLPQEAAVTVYALGKDVQARANAIRTQQSLTPAQRQEQLQALSAEANQKTTALLGERGHAAYVESGGYWLRNIAPQSAPAAGRAGSDATQVIRIVR
jgi:hypothetical protein